jgi:hypothetical protein
VITLTSEQMRNTRCTLLLLVLTGGRVMGSYDQMTLFQALGPPHCAAERVREERQRPALLHNRVAKWFPPFRLA